MMEAAARAVRQRWGVAAATTRPSTQLALVACLWVARYAINFGRHLQALPRWHSWFDQDRYVQSAIAFSRGDLSAGAHWYPPVYALIAAPFVAVMPRDPFFLPNLALYLIACTAFASVVKHFGIARRPALTIFVLATLVADSTASNWTIPWNTTLSAALTWTLIAVGARLVVDDERPPAKRRLIALGLIAGLLPAVRPTEAITSGSALIFIVVLLHSQHRLGMRTLISIAAGNGAGLLPFALLHLAIYGFGPSRYAIEAARQGFAFADLPWKSYVLMISAEPWYPGATAMIERHPWLLFGAAGMLVAGMRGPTRNRPVLMLITAVAIPYALLFSAYTDLQPPGLWEFGNAHYFAWLFPLAGAGCWLWVRALAKRENRVAAGALLLAVTLPAWVRPIALRVGDDQPARLLLFRGTTNRAWADAYFAHARIVDAEGTLENVRQFHQLPYRDSERAIATTRLFAGIARRDDPGEARRFATAEPPYARYAVRWTIGLPCWIARAACALPR